MERSNRVSRKLKILIDLKRRRPKRKRSGISFSKNAYVKMMVLRFRAKEGCDGGSF